MHVLPQVHFQDCCPQAASVPGCMISRALIVLAVHAASSPLDDAKKTLEGNWTGRNTIPAHGLYPHQRSWDSAFISIGYANYNVGRGYQELTALFEGMWSTGMLPHIVFNSSTPPGSYFPGPGFWLSSATSVESPRTVQTSGIIDPPMHPIAALKLFSADQSKSHAGLSACVAKPPNFVYVSMSCPSTYDAQQISVGPKRGGASLVLTCSRGI
jgi:hypothetical protein